MITLRTRFRILILCISLFCMTAMIALADVSDFQYTLLEDETIEITGYLGEDTDLEIPSVINGCSVTAIGNFAFHEFEDLTSIIIPDSVTSIGDYAFSRCTYLTSIAVPRSLISIGTHAFEYCIDLQNFTIPDSVISIGASAFRGCESLSSVVIPNGVTSIGDNTFQYCLTLESITIPASITFIGDHAFSWCSEYLTSITIPDSVNFIGQGAFEDCNGLTEIVVGPNSYALEYCMEYDLPYAVTIHDDSAELQNDEESHFQYRFLQDNTIEITGTDYLWDYTDLEIPSILNGYTVTSIGDSAFEWCDYLTHVTIPNTVTSIGNGAFSNCGSLTSVAIPNSVTNIGTNPFPNCYSLTSINLSPDHPLLTAMSGVLFTKTDRRLVFFPPVYAVSDYAIPDGTARIGNKAFYHCEGMNSITIPDSVTVIDEYAFEYCMDLMSISIPDSVTYIGQDAFEGCDSLSEVMVGQNSYAKQYCIDNDLPYIESTHRLSSETDPLSTGAYNDLPTLDASHFQYSLRNDGTIEITGYIGENTEFEIPNVIDGHTVTSIGKSAFYDCQNLKSITIPDSVTLIGDEAFAYCTNLIAITIPDTVTFIGERVLDHCGSLTEINIGHTNYTQDEIQQMVQNYLEQHRSYISNYYGITIDISDESLISGVRNDIVEELIQQNIQHTKTVEQGSDTLYEEEQEGISSSEGNYAITAAHFEPIQSEMDNPSEEKFAKESALPENNPIEEEPLPEDFQAVDDAVFAEDHVQVAQLSNDDAVFAEDDVQVTQFSSTENVPFFCGDLVASGVSWSKDDLLSGYMEKQDYTYRTDVEAIDYYTYTERTACIYDDGQHALLTSDSGYYLAEITDHTTAKIYAFLQTEYGIGNNEYGYLSLTTYKTEDGYWIIGNLGGSNGILYIDLVNGDCYFKSTKGLNISMCTSDRYMMLYNEARLIVVDLDLCEAEVFIFGGVGIVPYFDSEGIATLIINSKYDPMYQESRADFYQHNKYYYYSWKLGSIYEIAFDSYDYVCYADASAIIVESEFYYYKIEQGDIVWKIAKKDIVDNEWQMFSIQDGVLWRYGNSSNWYHTFIVPAEQTLMDYFDLTKELDEMHLIFGKPSTRIKVFDIGWSGRYDGCSGHVIDETTVFDQLDMKLYGLREYHFSHRIFNQNHVLWDNGLIQQLGGNYGVYSFVDDSYYQRTITY